MPYITPQQIEILDDLAARLGIVDKDAWVRDDYAYLADSPVGNILPQGIADLSDKEAAMLILQWRKRLASQMDAAGVWATYQEKG